MIAAAGADVPPRYADEHDTLASLAAHLLAERVAKYPAIVAAGKLSQPNADTGIRIMRAVAERWRGIAKRTGLPTTCACCDGASLREQRDTLVAATARTAQLAAADPTNKDRADYAAAVAALLWHANHAVTAEANCRDRYDQAA